MTNPLSTQGVIGYILRVDHLSGRTMITYIDYFDSSIGVSVKAKAKKHRLKEMNQYSHLCAWMATTTRSISCRPQRY